MITADQLLELAACSHTEIVDVPDIGKVRCRPLSAADAFNLAPLEGNEARAAMTLHRGLADPELTLEQATQLVADGVFGAVDRITRVILRLSGMDEGAQKSGGAPDDAGGD